jgi:hypothetical protein
VESAYNCELMRCEYKCDNKSHFLTPKYTLLKRHNVLEQQLFRAIQGCSQLFRAVQSRSEPFRAVRLSQNPQEGCELYEVESGCLFIFHNLFSFLQIFINALESKTTIISVCLYDPPCCWPTLCTITVDRRTG